MEMPTDPHPTKPSHLLPEKLLPTRQPTQLPACSCLRPAGTQILINIHETGSGASFPGRVASGYVPRVHSVGKMRLIPAVCRVCTENLFGMPKLLASIYY